MSVSVAACPMHLPGEMGASEEVLRSAASSMAPLRLCNLFGIGTKVRMGLLGANAHLFRSPLGFAFPHKLWTNATRLCLPQKRADHPWHFSKMVQQCLLRWFHENDCLLPKKHFSQPSTGLASFKLLFSFFRGVIVITANVSRGELLSFHRRTQVCGLASGNAYSYRMVLRQFSERGLLVGF